MRRFASTCLATACCTGLPSTSRLSRLRAVICNDFHYPNVVDFRRAATVAYHTVLGHAKAVQPTAPDITQVRSASCST